MSIIVPTLGTSPLLIDCLSRLSEQKGLRSEVVVVAHGQFEQPGPLPADRVLAHADNKGFTGNCNLAIAETESEFVALVNDDALVDDGWLETLLDTLKRQRHLGAAQGVNLQLENPRKVDGCGVSWNRIWRPVQIGHGLPRPNFSEPREIFGVSATAAAYRRSALHASQLDNGEVFDSRLISYYEDAELAIRLRKRNFASLVVPQATVRHAGSMTAKLDPIRHSELLVGNRYLVLARLLGRGFWSRWPALFARDLVDLIASASRARLPRTKGILAGLGRAAELISVFSHDAPGRREIKNLRPFRVLRASSWPAGWDASGLKVS